MISAEPLSKEEIKVAKKQLKNGKVPGVDNIAPEFLKTDLGTATDILHPLLVKIWNLESLPKDWIEGFLVKLPKKGDITNCHNCRGITLLSTPSKILSRMILNRI